MENARALCPTCGSEFPAGATFCPECGFVVPVSSPIVAVPVQHTVLSTPPANVLVVQPPAREQRETNWAPWLTAVVLLVLVGGGLILWNQGYMGGNPAPAPSSPTVTIENSPQMASDKPPVIVEIPANETPAPPAPTQVVVQTPAPAPADAKPDIDIISVKGQALEMNATEWKYGYTLRLRNNTNSAVKTSIRVQFIDDQGYPVDDDVLEGIVVPANSEVPFEGQDVIKTALAERISSLLAAVR